MKRCRTCGETKSADEFARGRGSCKPCQAAVARAYYARNKTRILERQRIRNRSPQGRDAWRRYKYGLDQTQYDALLQSQAGRCALGHAFVGEPVVDHDHATGTVRGLLCGACNCGLGLLRDDPELCEAAAEYLERTATNGR